MAAGASPTRSGRSVSGPIWSLSARYAPAPRPTSRGPARCSAPPVIWPRSRPGAYLEEPLDERLDVFGPGRDPLRCSTGLPPYTGPSGDEVYRKAARADLAEALARLDGCGAEAELVALAKSCLAAAPRDRSRDAGVVAAAMTAHLAGVLERLRAAELATARGPESRAAERESCRLQVAGLDESLLGLAALGGGGGLWLTHHRASRTEASARQANEAMHQVAASAWPGWHARGR